MNVPVPRLTCASNEVNDCVNTNTVTLFSQVYWYSLIQFAILAADLLTSINFIAHIRSSKLTSSLDLIELQISVRRNR